MSSNIIVSSLHFPQADRVNHFWTYFCLSSKIAFFKIKIRTCGSQGGGEQHTRHFWKASLLIESYDPAELTLQLCQYKIFAAAALN